MTAQTKNSGTYSRNPTLLNIHMLTNLPSAHPLTHSVTHYTQLIILVMFKIFNFFQISSTSWSYCWSTWFSYWLLVRWRWLLSSCVARYESIEPWFTSWSKKWSTVFTAPANFHGCNPRNTIFTQSRFNSSRYQTKKCFGKCISLSTCSQTSTIYWTLIEYRDLM